jgi:hypothetical protein
VELCARSRRRPPCERPPHRRARYDSPRRRANLRAAAPGHDPAHSFHLRIARLDVNAFISACFTDASGAPVVQAPVHAELQEFLGAHPKALVELPRDHGKSFQVCCRVLWELGRDPGLRVKIVCATDAVAVERARFLRDSIEHNAAVRAAFPHLRRGHRGRSARSAVQRDTQAIGPSVAAFGPAPG